ncbi:MAG: ECF-type sigma factor [Wenzhouxiangella sp.]
MSEITQLLVPEDGSAPDLDAVFERLYPKLKQQARYSLMKLPHGATLTPTVLVAEAYVKLINANSLGLSGQRHFFACAARAMRHIILDQLRRSQTDKRRAQEQAITLNPEHLAMAQSSAELLDLEKALDELGRLSPQQRELVELKFFAGLNVREIARLMEMSERSTWREWERAKAFLHVRLQR